MISPIEWKNTSGGPIVRMLDQKRLPLAVEWIECTDYQTVARGIKDLSIRGAPAIGIAAAMGFALGAQSVMETSTSDFFKSLEKIKDALAATRPTAVNLFWALNRMNKVAHAYRDSAIEEIRAALIDEALQIHREEIGRNEAIGRHGAKLILGNGQILTHCNTGALATGGHGTALGVVVSAWNEGKKVHVWVDETRPLLQGSRLTMWELQQNKIPCTLITDSMAGVKMKQGEVNLCIVGADRIAANGDTANKIGTYSVAVLAHAHHIPFYVAAPTSTIDFSLDSGDKIPIEQRNPQEVTSVMGKVQITPDNAQAENPAFDVTPARYITGIITEHGVFKPGELKER